MIIDFLLNQTCTIQPCIGCEDGAEAYGPEQTRRCRLQENRQLQAAGGIHGTADAAPARAIMYCRGDAVPLRSRIVCEGTTYVVSACRRLQALGQDHLEVMLE